MLARTAGFCRYFCRMWNEEALDVAKEAKTKYSLDTLKKKAGELKTNSGPYIKE